MGSSNSMDAKPASVTEVNIHAGPTKPTTTSKPPSPLSKEIEKALTLVNVSGIDIRLEDIQEFVGIVNSENFGGSSQFPTTVVTPNPSKPAILSNGQGYRSGRPHKPDRPSQQGATSLPNTLTSGIPKPNTFEVGQTMKYLKSVRKTISVVGLIQGVKE